MSMKAADQIAAALREANFRCLGTSDSTFEVWADGRHLVLVEHAKRSGTEVYVPIIADMRASKTIEAIRALNSGSDGDGDGGSRGEPHMPPPIKANFL